MKVGVIGANGQLGHDVVAEFTKKGGEVIALNHDVIDISNAGSVQKVFSEIKPQIVVNTAAMHHVETCESEPERSFAVNGLGAKNLADVSNKLAITLIHISTDYVFDGSQKTPYSETDLPAPLNVYGNTKLAGEFFVQSATENYFILRTSGLYGDAPCRAKGLNFVELMIKLSKEREEIRVVDNEVLTPTSTLDLAKQIVALSQTQHYGLYHCTAQGFCSWYQFAKKIFELTDASVKLSIADPKEFPAKVPRPYYSVLENKHLKKHQLDFMPSWETSLATYITNRT